MSVSTFEPKQISVTDAASAHIRGQIAQSGHKYLRLGVKESGCNGYMYTLDFLSEPESSDRCFEVASGVRICVQDEDMPFVEGTVVDMVTEGLNSALVFKNPNAQSYCGCGESFAFAGEEDDDNVDIGDLATNVGNEAG